MSERWLVAMSGGVDSSVAAALTVRSGVETIGITLDLGGDGDTREPGRCCGLPDADDAREVARVLGIRHYVANYREPFRTAVIEPFLQEYREGRTPIPCVACNRVLKFDLLVRRADALGARGVVTGHYARIAAGPDGGPALYRPADREKDQTYFLFDVPRAALPRIRFPLAGLDKSGVRALAREAGLGTAEKRESQGICFVPEGKVRRALARLAPDLDPGPGPIVDREGRDLGTHAGAIGHTPGQRRGLGLGAGPWYVAEVEPAANRIVVDRREALRRDRIEIARASWHDGAAPEGEVRVQVRHRQRAVPARIEVAPGGRAAVRFAEPVWAPAPGQAAVVYDSGDQRVLGGGWIVA